MPDYERIGKMVSDALIRKNALYIYRHLGGLNISATFDDDQLFRYRLEVLKADINEGKTVCAIMQNPSYADEDIADKSVNFLERLIFSGNVPVFSRVKRLIIVNQFAFVQTNDFKGGQATIGTKNMCYIGDAITESDIVLIAWGASNKHKDKIYQIEKILKKYPDKKIFETIKHPSLGSLSEDFIIEYVMKT
jgi:hypothetical protein